MTNFEKKLLEIMLQAHKVNSCCLYMLKEDPDLRIDEVTCYDIEQALSKASSLANELVIIKRKEG